jgi:hypothetical protein
MFQLVVFVQAQKMEVVTMAVHFGLDLDPVAEMKVEILGILMAVPLDQLVFYQ